MIESRGAGSKPNAGHDFYAVGRLAAGEHPDLLGPNRTADEDALSPLRQRFYLGQEASGREAGRPIDDQAQTRFFVVIEQQHHSAGEVGVEQMPLGYQELSGRRIRLRR